MVDEGLAGVRAYSQSLALSKGAALNGGSTSSTKENTSFEDFEALERRITKLERVRFGLGSSTVTASIVVDDSMRRARHDVETRGVYSAQWKWVREEYYKKSLQERADWLGASSTAMLCKSLLLENKNATGKDEARNPKFILLVLQYEAVLDVRKLTNAIRSLTKKASDRLDYKNFDYRIATPEDNDKITGYAFNSVTPFGMLRDVPIVVSQEVVPLHYFWMGGGHVHLKLGMAVSDFVKATNAMVADISQPRSGTAAADNGFDLVDSN